MKTLMIPLEHLRHSLASAIAARGAGQGATLSLEERHQLQKVLASACHGPVALKEYLAQLTESKRSIGSQGNDLLITEIPGAAVVKKGLAVLSDEQLVRLATSAEAIRQLNLLIEQALDADELGDFWWDAYSVPDSAIPPGYLDDQTFRRILDDVRDTSDDPKTASEPDTVMPTFHTNWRGWRAFAGPILALAACLLIGIAIGWFIRGGRHDRYEILVANAKVEPSLIRGPNDEKLQQVRIKGPFDGFVVVIALAPDRKQRVFPEFGADDKPVATGAESDGIPVPADTTRAIYIVTETPAGEPIRRAFEGKNARRFSPDQEAELRRELEDLLTKKGYRRAAIGSTTVVPVP